MKRSIAPAALVLMLALSGTASAKVAALARYEDDLIARYALAGDTAWFAGDSGQSVAVYSVPADGSARAVARMHVQAVSPDDDALVLVGGSARRAAALVTEPTDDDHGTTQLYTGPASGPLAAAGGAEAYGDPATYESVYPYIDDARVFTVGLPSEDFSSVRFRLAEGDGSPTDIVQPWSTTLPAGDLVGAADGRTLTIRNWRTGARRTVTLPVSIESAAVRADGAAVVGHRNAGIYAVSPAGAVTRVSKTGFQPSFAGEDIVYVDRFGRDQTLMIAAPGRRPRRFGVPTQLLLAFVADDRRVLWSANGCLLAAPLTARAVSAPAGGPCPRTELDFEGDRVHVGADRRARVTLRCVAAPRACRGSMRFTLGGPVLSSTVRFSIPYGERRTVSPKLTTAAYRSVSRSGRSGKVLDAEAVSTDPAGRRSVAGYGFTLTVR